MKKAVRKGGFFCYRKRMKQAKSIVIGTHNPDKLKELSRLLQSSKLRVRSLVDFPGCPEAVEDGRTFDSNARKKARLYSRYTKSLAFADDSGLMVRALGNRPGVYSARFAGPNCTYADNNRKVLGLLKGKRDRRAKFVCVIALYDLGKFVASVRGECEGVIVESPKGSKGFGYDPVFVPRGLKKTFAELSPHQKGKVSHRGKALAAAKKAILRYLVTA